MAAAASDPPSSADGPGLRGHARPPRAAAHGLSAAASPSPARARRATLASVAQRAGVSPQTVSNVINSPHLVRSDTAARVRAVIAELSYRPQFAAKQLRTGRSQLLGMRIHQTPDPVVFDRFLHSVTEIAARLGYRVMLYTAADDAREIDTFDELLDRWSLDGIVLSYTHAGDQRTSHLAKLGVPCVSFGRPWDSPGEHSWVDVDGSAGTRAATEHLIACGHRRIGFIGWPEGSDTGDDRLGGWAAAMTAAGLPAPPPMRCENDVTQGRRAATELIVQEEVSAIVCVSDLVGVGALSAATALGLRVGSDLAVVGFDDSDRAKIADMTSIAQPLPLVAEHCVRIVVQQITRGINNVAAEHVLLPPTLKLRGSTGRREASHPGRS